MAAQSQLDRKFLSFQQYVAQRGRFGLSDDAEMPLYAHPVDAWIMRSLNTLPVRSLIEKALDVMITQQIGQYLANGIFIDHKSFPDLFAVLVRCSETLGIPMPHAVANSSPYLFNAFTAGTDEYTFINITSGLCEYFSHEEACFVIGHECGHIASRHMELHTLGWILQDMATSPLGMIGAYLRAFAIPLQAWSRRSEVTADRAGLLCCGDISIAERALLRLVAGHADVDRVDIDDYLRRAKDMTDFHRGAGWQELMYSHPMIPKRIEALRLFAQSELYYDLSAKPRMVGATLLRRAELDRRVNAIVRP